MFSLKMIPGAAYRLNEKISIGGGLLGHYTKAKMNALSPATGEKTDYSGGSDIDLGFNLGAIYKQNDQLTYGFNYSRGATSKIDDYAGQVFFLLETRLSGLTTLAA